MDITIEACKPDSYVGCPAPAVTPPECAHGWEIGNGTITCAAVPAQRDEPLAATGPAVDPWIGLVLAAAAIVMGFYGIAWSRRRIAREEEEAGR